MDIRLPTQSLFLAGESLEVDNLVKRARPIDGADPRARALVPQPMPPVAVTSRAINVSETNVDYASISAAYQARTRGPADLYRQVRDAAQLDRMPRFVDVYA